MTAHEEIVCELGCAVRNVSRASVELTRAVRAVSRAVSLSVALAAEPMTVATLAYTPSVTALAFLVTL